MVRRRDLSSVGGRRLMNWPARNDVVEDYRLNPLHFGGGLRDCPESTPPPFRYVVYLVSEAGSAHDRFQFPCGCRDLGGNQGEQVAHDLLARKITPWAFAAGSVPTRVVAIFAAIRSRLNCFDESGPAWSTQVLPRSMGK